MDDLRKIDLCDRYRSTDANSSDDEQLWMNLRKIDLYVIHIDLLMLSSSDNKQLLMNLRKINLYVIHIDLLMLSSSIDE